MLPKRDTTGGSDLVPERRDLPSKPEMGAEGFDKIFDNYDRGNIKPGAPYVGVYGAMRCAWCQGAVVVSDSKPKCGQCGREMRLFEEPDLGQHNQWQRRQLSLDAPKEQKLQPNLTFEELGKGTAIPSRPRDANFDLTKYPSQTGPDFGA